MNRRSFVASLAVLGFSGPTDAEPKPEPPQALLLGDSEAYLLARPFRAAAHAYRVPVATDGRGGSSARQWLKRGWFEAALKKHRPRTVLISLGVNCTRVERPVLARDAGELVLIANDLDVAPVWLLPPPLAMDNPQQSEAVSERCIRTSDTVQSLPVPERSALLALAHQARAALPEGPSHARELVCELERRLEAAQADAEGSEVAS